MTTKKQKQKQRPKHLPQSLLTHGLRSGVGGEVFPRWVVRFNECDFFFAGEVFQIFFAGDGVVDVLEAFEVDETVGFVF
jgi:hypothetical protein